MTVYNIPALLQESHLSKLGLETKTKITNCINAKYFCSCSCVCTKEKKDNKKKTEQKCHAKLKQQFLVYRMTKFTLANFTFSLTVE